MPTSRVHKHGPADRVRSAFTFVELLVVFVIVGILVGLLLPALQTAREASRRVGCQEHLKQLGQAILGFESARTNLPIGARVQHTTGFPSISSGMSWWVDLLPYLELRPLVNQLDFDGSNIGLVLVHPTNGRVIDGFAFELALCPSSSLPTFETVSQFRVMMPSYVGISGASNDQDFPESRISPCCVPRNNGVIAAGGVLLPNRAIQLAEVSDGASTTMAVGECSAYSYSADGSTYRVDGGFRLGWLLGTSVTGTPPEYGQPHPAWNITTIRYSLNELRYDLPGIYTDRGPNNPLNSSHPDIVNLLLLDGSVVCAADNLSIALLHSLATRDDHRADIGLAH